MKVLLFTFLLSQTDIATRSKAPMFIRFNIHCHGNNIMQWYFTEFLLPDNKPTMEVRRTQLCLLIPLKELSVLSPFLCSVWKSTERRRGHSSAGRKSCPLSLAPKTKAIMHQLQTCWRKKGSTLHHCTANKAAFNKRSGPTERMLILKIFDEPARSFV